MVSLCVSNPQATLPITPRSLDVLSLLRLSEWQGCTLSSRYANNRIAQAVANYSRVVDEVFPRMSDPRDSLSSSNRKDEK
jgi:hypothetical protein